jgi:hypothetical protein
MKTKTLHCQIGDHDWDRESKRGRYPVNCPEHQPVVEEVEKKTGLHQIITGEARRAAIEEIITKRPCDCIIHGYMDDDELMHVTSCAPHWVCSTLDAVRRRVVNYNRHFNEADFEVSL